MGDKVSIYAIFLCLALIVNAMLAGYIVVHSEHGHKYDDFFEIGMITILVLSSVSLVAILQYRNRLKSETKRAEEAVARAHHLMSLFDNAPVEMCVKDINGKYLYVNSEFEKLIGLMNQDVVGKRSSEVLTQDLSRAATDHDLAVINSGKVVTREMFAETSLGLKHLHMIKFPIFEKDNQIKSIGSVVTDVTPLREMTQLLRKTNQQMNAILQNAPVGIFLKDEHGCFTIANPTICQYIGFPKDKILGKSNEMLFTGELLEQFQSTDQQILATKKPVTYESRHIVDGYVFDIEVHKFPILDDAGEVVGIGGVEVDVTDHMRIQRELLLAKEEADKANRSKSDFLANMSHEIRTPLNAILGFSEILSTEVFGPIGSERYKNYARDIYQSGSHLMDLISDILDLSKIEAGRLELAEDIVDLGEAFDNSLNVVRTLASERAVTLSVSTDVKAVIAADRRAVHQVLINLVTNAVKFTPAEGKVVLSVLDQDDGGLEILIQDTGIGISSEDLDIVFDVFTQVRAPDQSHQPGSGIGLAIVKQLCNAMDWSINLQSELQKGTLVSLTLPSSAVIKPNGNSR
ncbi:MAG: PAS domain S-box protein [Alphaproteobacteria bacterium]|nr:PAS domain S-box protein [Alphaproteobacteria bacterium]